jgi:curved DNA-binding protein
VEFKDYYKIMGVDPKADPDAIKKAYKKLARRYHPDVSKERDAEKKFKELGEAYDVLRDEDKRGEYDRLREMGANHDGSFTPPPGWNPGAYQHSSRATHADFSDFFETLFGGAGFGEGHADDPTAHLRGQDIHHELALLLEEAFHGCEQVVELRVPDRSGHGRGSIHTRKLKIKVPAGVTSGSVLRLKGQGAPGIRDAAAGDLLVTIRLAAHPLYSIDGKNISLVAPVAPWEAALGCKLDVPTLAGKARVTVPAQSQTGQKLRLAGKGMPGTPPGDFLVVLKVVMPETLTDKARELYAQLKEELDFNPRQAWEKQ